MHIKVERHELSDHSEVFDVVLTQDGKRIFLHAFDERCAHILADALVRDIEANAAEVVRFI
jgi:hypothetical protein